ncbi:MAG: CinA family protein, partial [Mariprofundaceae bacterium]
MSMLRGMIEVDAAGLAAMMAEGVTPGWMIAWLAARGVEAGWRMVEIGADAADAPVVLRVSEAADWRPAGCDEARQVALDDPARRARLFVAGDRRVLVLPPGGFIHERDRWLDALAGPARRKVWVRWDEAGEIALEPGLSASMSPPPEGVPAVSDAARLPEEVLVARMQARGMRLRLAESCTGGMIAARICRVPGASTVFDRGWVTYANEAKMEELGVPAALIDRDGAVSRETVEAMVAGMGEAFARI